MTTKMITDPKTEKQIEVTLMSREDYLAQRSAWRTSYKKLSADIRETKLAIKAAHRALDGDEVGSLSMTREILRDYANSALEERRIMKLAAQASYQVDQEERLAA